MLTLERARETFRYEPDTGHFIRLRQCGHNQRQIGAIAGSLNDQGYRRIMLDRKDYRAHRLAWFMTHGTWPAEIDHINGIRDDNRIANLRPADRFINTQNTSCRADNKSGYQGVSFYRPAGKWRAQIKKDGKSVGLGSFDSPQAAHEAYLQAKCEFHPGFVRRAAMAPSGERP